MEDPLATRFDFFNFVDCRSRPINSCESFSRRNEIDQMVRNSAALVQRHLGGRDLYLLINLN